MSNHSQHPAPADFSVASHAAPPLPVFKRKPNARLPAYQTEQAAGLDLTACLEEEETIVLQPLERRLLGTGLSVAIPQGFEGQVRPRSGWALKEGVTLLNSPGTIDSDYRGEVAVLLVNLSTKPVQIRHGDRIAQMIVAPVVKVAPCWVEQLDDTKRGAGGFGHTGRG